MWKIADQARSEALAALSPGEREQLVGPARARARHAAAARSQVRRLNDGRRGGCDRRPAEYANSLQRRAAAARLRWVLMGGGVASALVAGLWYYLAHGPLCVDRRFLGAGGAGDDQRQCGRARGRARRARQPAGARAAMCCFASTIGRSASRSRRRRRSWPPRACRSSAAKATYRQQLADLAAARDTLAYQQHEFERQQRLLQSGISSRAQFEQAQHARAAGAVAAQLGAAAGRQRAGAARRQSRICHSSSIRWCSRRRRRSTGPISICPIPWSARPRTASSPRSSSCRSATTSTPPRRCSPDLDQRCLGRGQFQGRRARPTCAPGQTAEVTHRCLSGTQLQGARSRA